MKIKFERQEPKSFQPSPGFEPAVAVGDGYKRPNDVAVQCRDGVDRHPLGPRIEFRSGSDCVRCEVSTLKTGTSGLVHLAFKTAATFHL